MARDRPARGMAAREEIADADDTGRAYSERPMSSLTHPCRLAVFLARDAPVAVLLRRGPSRWVEVIRWDTRRDTFEHGQWLHGRIDERKCDLAPDGQLFLYFAYKPNPRARAGGYGACWTALSRPPWLTALALWPHETTYDGGGVFETNTAIWMLQQYRPHPDHPAPPELQIVTKPEFSYFSTDFSVARLEGGGWRLIEEARSPTAFRRDSRPRLWRKPHPTRPYCLYFWEAGRDPSPSRGADASEITVRDERGGQERAVAGATWADWDQQGRLVFVGRGRLFADASPPFRDPRLLRDFNPDVPRTLAAPSWARRR